MASRLLDDLQHCRTVAADPQMTTALITAGRPRWHADALCREYPGLSWYPAPGAPDRELRDICNACLVSSECLAFALEHDEVGIWGGRSANERKKLRTTLRHPRQSP
jgi:Transcription factor WhiB